MSGVAARSRTTSRPAAPTAPARFDDLLRFLPSRRSLAVGVALLVLAAGAYVVARQTSLFALRTVDVRGGTPQIRAEVRSALADEVGTSLLRIGDAGLARRIAALPDVRSFTFDRSFPHTLQVVVRRERPVLVVRRVPGTEAYLVAASGRVMRLLPHPRASHLPRLWVRSDVRPTVGAPLPAALADAARATAAARSARLPGGVRVVQERKDELTLELGSGVEVRLGDAGDLALKLAIARRVLAVLGPGLDRGYVDVSVPERPVADPNPQVGG